MKEIKILNIICSLLVYMEELVLVMSSDCITQMVTTVKDLNRYSLCYPMVPQVVN